MPSRPAAYLNWTDGSGTKVTQPPAPQQLSGWTEGEPIPFQYLNWLFWITDQWIQYLDNQLNDDVTALNLDQTMRLINGGTWSWNLGTSTLSWSTAFNLAIPSIADADNQAAAGSIALSDGQVAYVAANVPFTTTGNTTSGSNEVDSLAFTTGITVGQTVTGSGIPGGTTVSSISGTTVFLSANATATASGVNLTFSGVGALTVVAATSSTLLPAPNTIIVARRVGAVVFVGVNSVQMALRDSEAKLLNYSGYLTVLSVVAGENLTANQAVYISNGSDGGRTAGRAYKTDAGSANGLIRSQLVGFVATTVLSGATAVVICGGNMPGFSLTSGASYYLDPVTLGGITATRPATANLYLVPVGIGISATTLQINPVTSQVITAITGVGLGSGDTLAIDPGTQSPYNVTSANNGQVLLVNSANGAQQMNLPAPAANLIFTFKDIGGQLDVNNLTLHRNAGEKIEGLAADYIAAAPFGEWTVSCDGTDWMFSAR